MTHRIRLREPWMRDESRRSWSRGFNWPRDLGGEQLWLVIDNVGITCAVTLNGYTLGTTNGPHAEWNITVLIDRHNSLTLQCAEPSAALPVDVQLEVREAPSTRT